MSDLVPARPRVRPALLAKWSIVALSLIAFAVSCASDAGSHGKSDVDASAGEAGGSPVDVGGMAGEGRRPDASAGTAGEAGTRGEAGSQGEAGSATSNGIVATTTSKIGMEGGSVTLTGSNVGTVTIDIPAGAISEPTSITIIETDELPPKGYTAYSPVYRFEPEGTVFNKPITITLPFHGDAHLATLFWSRNDATGYDRVGGIPLGTKLTGSARHFSKGFVADGVDYTDPPDATCVVSKLIEGRTSGYSTNVQPGKTVSAALLSSVAMFFTVDDCQGRPITGLTERDFTVEEDGTSLSSEAVPTVLPKPGLTIFASLVLDMSSSTKNELRQMIDGAKAFVSRLQAQSNQLDVQISIELFSGAAALTEWQAPTLDTGKLLAQLDALVRYTPSDPSSTNLYGAVIQSLGQLRGAELAFEQRNYGGSLTSGYVVLFTDGADTAGLQTLQQALAAESADSVNQVLAVGLQSSPDYVSSAQVALAKLANNGLISSDDPTTLARDFEALAARIAGQVTRTYLLGYCSPKRAGQHTVSVKLVGSKNQTSAGYEFSASKFGPGCTASAFASACTSAAGELTCGGLGCGACDDRAAACDGTTGHCSSSCKLANKCGGATFTNSQGYVQVCTDVPESTACGVACKDLTRDDLNCGACGNACVTASGAHCIDGACGGCGPAVSPVTAMSHAKTACGNRCVDTTTDVANCGGCGLVCPATGHDIAMCVDAKCRVATALSPITLYVGTLVARESNLYWLDRGSVQVLPVTGGTPVPIVSPYLSLGGCELSTSALALDANYVYWPTTNNGQGAVQLMRAPLHGGLAATFASYGGYGGCAVAVDSNNVYWSGSGGVLAYRVPLAGGPPILIVPFGTGVSPGGNPTPGIASDGSSVFLTDYNAATIVQAPLAECHLPPGQTCPTSNSSVFASTTQFPGGIAVRAGSVFWTVDSSVASKLIDGSVATPKILASGFRYIHTLAVDETSAYFIGSATGTEGLLVKVPLTGGALTVVASGVAASGAIAVDDSNVYWANNGWVMKIAKQPQ